MSARDVVVLASVVVAFGALATAHVAIAVGLFARVPLARAIAGLVVPPLAPYYAMRARMYARALAWSAALLAYAVARVLAAS